MGTEYTIYTEINIKDKWYGMDSYVLTPSGKYRLSPLLSGKSYVRRFLGNLDSNHSVHFSDLAATTQKYIREETDKEYHEHLSAKSFAVYDFYTAVRPKYVREYQYEYYALRLRVSAFETGEIDEICDWLTRESYEELHSEEQKEYVFFKWTEPDSWYNTLSKVITRVEMRLADFREEACWDDDMWKDLQQTNPVRLIVEVN